MKRIFLLYCITGLREEHRGIFSSRPSRPFFLHIYAVFLKKISWSKTRLAAPYESGVQNIPDWISHCTVSFVFRITTVMTNRSDSKRTPILIFMIRTTLNLLPSLKKSCGMCVGFGSGKAASLVPLQLSRLWMNGLSLPSHNETDFRLDCMVNF